MCPSHIRIGNRHRAYRAHGPCVPYNFYGKCFQNVCVCLCRDTRLVCPNSHPYRERASCIPGARTVRPYIFMENAFKMFAYACVGTHGSCVRTHIRIGNGHRAYRTHGPCVPTFLWKILSKMFVYACVGTHGSCVRVYIRIGNGHRAYRPRLPFRPRTERKPGRSAEEGWKICRSARDGIILQAEIK